jgi:hypothetical protein
MNLLSWPTALLFAGIAVPLLLLLYFLKLRRQERSVSSTLLWKKAVLDLQVNAPFQKLRRNLLLFLQLLLLAAVLLAIADPVANFLDRPQKNVVIMIDRSASMQTVEEDGRSRLEHATEAAVDYVSHLDADVRAMVISFADVPTVECTFTHDARRLARLIRGIEAIDGPSRIGEALPLAVAYSTNLVDIPGIAASSVPEAAVGDAADIEFFSDGRIADADQQYVMRGTLRYYRVGARNDNAGIVAFDVKRIWDRPGMLSVFVQVANFGPDPIQSDVSISLNGKLLPGAGAVREVSLGPGQAFQDGRPAERDGGSADQDLPPAQNVLFEFFHDSGGVIEVRLHRADALATDNVVVAPIDPPRQVRVLAVTDRWPVELYLTRFMKELEIEDFQLMKPDAFEQAPDDALIAEGRSAFDLVIFDRHDTDRLPPGNYVSFGCLPKIEGVSAGDDIEGEPLIYGREDHPLIRYVNYDGLYVARWRRLELPPHAVTLIEGSDSVVMAMLTDPGHRYVITAFDLLESNFLNEVAFPIFMQNAIGYLAGGGMIADRRLVQPGETISIALPPGAQEVRIRRPNGHIDEPPVPRGSFVNYARTQDVGVYEVSFDDDRAGPELYAANLLDAVESNIAPADKFRVGSEAVESIERDAKVNEPLWPYLAAAAILILLLEWWIYNRRIMI